MKPFSLFEGDIAVMTHYFVTARSACPPQAGDDM